MPAQASFHRGSRTWPFRYEILDGLRGLASLAVVAQHLGITAVGHYAVMLFFVISGYCITASAESCRRKALTFGAFMWRRVRRIYPPYFLAIVFYALTRVGKYLAHGPNDLARSWDVWVQNLTLTQWISLPLHPVADPSQNPKLLVAAFWSLNYEEQFYLVVALALLLCVRRRVPMIAVVLGLSAAALTWNLAAPGGWITGFFLEYWAHFSLGAILFYVLCVYPARIARVSFVAAVSALFLYCLWQILPWRPEYELQRRAFVELAVVSGFTLALLLARPVSAWIARRALWRPIAGLGAISYSLYLIHQFNLTLVESTINRIAGFAPASVRLTLMLALFVLIAVLFWYCCESPFVNRPVSETGTPGGTATKAATAHALPSS